jgi:hypothetical protein
MGNTKQKLSERKRLSKIINDWAGKNRKVFWKYEVSCFYQSYRIKVANLPNPTSKHITVSKNNRLLNDLQKTQLCNAIEKARVQADVLSDSSIDVKIDFVNGNVVTELV